MRLKFVVFLVAMLILMSSAIAVTTTIYDSIDTSANLDSTNTMLSFMKHGSFIVVNMINQQPDPVEPGDYVELRFKIENEGPDTFEGATFEIIPEYPFSLDPNEEATRYIGDLKGRAVNENAIVIKYKVRVAEDAVEGDTPIKLRYLSSAEEWREEIRWSETDEFLVKVETPDSVLNVESITTVPENIKPGQPAQVIINLENLADSVLRSITAKLNIDGTDFSVIGSSNEKTLKSLDGSASEEIEFGIVANYDIESKVHKINLELAYEDANGNEFEKNLTIGLQVFDEPQYLLNLEENKAYSKDQKGSMVVSLSNIGSSMLRFATLELIETEDYKILSVPKVYLGNLESDDFETSEYDLFVSSDEKQVPLKLQLIFKDDFNKEYVLEETLTLNMFTNKELKKYQIIQPQSRIGLVIFILILLVIAWFVYKKWEKKRKKKKK
jgi:hypothetical protein